MQIAGIKYMQGGCARWGDQRQNRGPCQSCDHAGTGVFVHEN